MSATTWVGHGEELPVSKAQPINVPGAVAGGDEAQDMSPFAFKIVLLTLAFGVVFLATLGAWVWYAAYQYQNIG